MTAKEHTNLLSIFAWAYAGIQALVVCLYLLFVLVYGGLGIAMAFTSKQSDAAGLVVWGVMVLIVGSIALMGIICVISNIRLGKQLRSGTPPTQRSMIVSAILNFISWICGGIFLMPFGIALGVYSIWFSQSDVGKAFLEGREYQPNHAFPPNPQYYPVQQPRLRKIKTRTGGNSYFKEKSIRAKGIKPFARFVLDRIFRYAFLFVLLKFILKEHIKWARSLELSVREQWVMELPRPQQTRVFRSLCAT